VRFQVPTAASIMFRIVFWVILLCKMIVDQRFRGAYCLRTSETSVDNHFTRQYNPEDNSEHDRFFVEFSTYKGWVCFLKSPSRLIQYSNVYSYLQTAVQWWYCPRNVRERHTQWRFTNASACLITPFHKIHTPVALLCHQNIWLEE
jgi:hypothetical protein